MLYSFTYYSCAIFVCNYNILCSFDGLRILGTLTPLYGSIQCKSNIQSRWQMKFTLAIAIRSTDLESNQSTVRVRSTKPRKGIHNLNLPYKFVFASNYLLISGMT